MGDRQKDEPIPNFDLTGDGSPIYDSDSQLRTAIIRRLLNEYRTTNYFLANAMQSTFLRFFIHEPYAQPSEYNRPKSDSNYYEPKSNDHIKIEELNIKTGQFNENYNDNNMSKISDRRNKVIYATKPKKFSKSVSFRSEFDTSSDENESELLTGRTMHYSSENEKKFKFIDDIDEKYEDQYEDKFDKDSSDDDYEWNKQEQSAESKESRQSSKTISCSFNSNRSSIDNYNDDTNHSSDRKCISNMKNNDEYAESTPKQRETKWQVFCELYEELKEQNSEYSSTSTSSNKYYDSRSHSSLEKKINAAINKLKNKDIKKAKNVRLKLNKYNKKTYSNESSSDTEEVLIRNRYLKNKRIYNTKKYFSNKFRSKKEQVESSSSEDDKLENNSPDPVKTPPKEEKCEELHVMNDKLIHETIFENSEEERYPVFPNYFDTFMDKYSKNFELIHKKGSTNLTGESGTNNSFNPDIKSIDKIDKITNLGQSSSSFDSIDDKSIPLPIVDDEKKSSSTICLKSLKSGFVDSGVGTSVDKIDKNEDKLDEITIVQESANSSAEWSNLCKTKLKVSKLPFRFSSSSKSKSSISTSDGGEIKIKNKPKMRVIFKREATVIDLFNNSSSESVLKINEKQTRFRCLRNLFSCCSR